MYHKCNFVTFYFFVSENQQNFKDRQHHSVQTLLHHLKPKPLGHLVVEEEEVVVEQEEIFKLNANVKKFLQEDSSLYVKE